MSSPITSISNHAIHDAKRPLNLLLYQRRTTCRLISTPDLCALPLQARHRRRRRSCPGLLLHPSTQGNVSRVRRLAQWMLTFLRSKSYFKTTSYGWSSSLVRVACASGQDDSRATALNPSASQEKRTSSRNIPRQVRDTPLA